jgi:hypothetical protein
MLRVASRAWGFQMPFVVSIARYVSPFANGKAASRRG